MMVDTNLVPNNPEDNFMLAVERLAAGEALETVLLDFSAAERDELRELLTVVAATHHLQEIDIPRPLPQQRAARKATFLQAAAAMKLAVTEAELVTSDPAIATAPLAVSAQRVVPRPAVAMPTLWEQIAAWWANVMQGFAPMTLRLTPLAIMLFAIWLGAFSVVSVAQAAIPGDAAYPAKTWIYAQKLTLSAPEDRSEVYDNYIAILTSDIVLAGERAAQEKKIIRVETDLILTSVGRSHIEAGSLVIELNYQTSLDSDQTFPMTMTGIPVEGAQAHVVYQIVPGPDGLQGQSVLQGISLEVEQEPLVMPTVIPTVIESTDLPVVNPSCATAAPSGWIQYTVPTGATLSDIARQSGTSVNQLTLINCIDNPNLIRSGSTLWVPRLPVAGSTPTTVPATSPPLALTLTSISTTQPSLTGTVPADATPTVAITATVLATVTAVITTPEAEATAPLTTTVRPTTVVTVTIVPSMTPTATTVVPTATPVVTVVMTKTQESTPEPTPESTVAETPVASPEAATSEATAVATEVPTESTAEVTPTPVTTPVAPTTPTTTPDESNSSDGVSGASSGDSDEAKGDGGVEPDIEATAPVTTDGTTVPPTVVPSVDEATEKRTRPLPTTTPTAITSSPLGKD